MKAQSSFEMLVSVATLLAYTIPLVLLLFSLTQLRLEDISISSGRATVQQLSDTINEVHLQGAHAKRSLILDLPSNSQNLSVSGNSIILRLSTTSGPYEISHPVLANVSDFSISSRSGLINIIVKTNGTQVVLE